MVFHATLLAMQAVFLLSFFILGAIVGSFLNVLVLRYGVRSLQGRSACLSCGKTLRFFELIPILSFLLQKGRCGSCKVRISLQYPLVEFLTGLIFMCVFWKYSSRDLLLHATRYTLYADLLFWSLFIAIGVYDLRHKIIPNGLVYGAVALALLIFCFRLWQSGFYPQWLLDLLGGPFLALPFAMLWFFSRGRAMGLGDAKLLLSFSWLLGFVPALSALFIGFWFGLAAVLVGFLFKAVLPAFRGGAYSALKSSLRGLTMKTELPLAPFLILGFLVVYLFSIDVTGLSILLQE